MNKLYLSCLLLSACTSNIELDSVDYETLFNDGNSKVWTINKVVYNDAIISPIRTIDKDLLTFYNDGTCQQIPMKEIGRTHPKKASYYLNSRGKDILIIFEKFTAEYNLVYLTEDSILLEPTPDSETQFTMQLVPFQKL